MMANTYTSLHYHIVFSTKNRELWIKPDVEQRIWAYLGGIAKQNKMKPLQIGGIEDHVHVLLGAPAVLAPAKIAQLLKGGSSAWIHETLPRMEGFGWQDGYGAFTVSKSNIPTVAEYIQGQRVHHRMKSFQDEYRELLKRHEIDFDERYVWG
jgi:putative transposase